jgi:predicted PurR-regulated permease PerM
VTTKPGAGTGSRATGVAIWAIAVLLMLFFLRAARALLIPIALGVLVSYALAPLVTLLERWRVPRILGAGLVLLALLAAGGGGAYALRHDAKELANAVPHALAQGREIVLSQLGPAGPTGSDGQGREHGGGESSGGSRAQPVGTSGQITSTLLERGVETIPSVTGHLVVIFFLIYFLLVSGHHARNRLVEIAGPDAARRQTAATIIDDVNAQIQRYLVVLLVTAVIVGLATWLVLAWMGVAHAPMWGLLAGVFNSIPYFGPVIVAGGLFVLGMVQGGGMTQALQMSGAAIVITSLEGWLLTPALMGKAERMSVLAVFLGLLLWTWVWGAWGTVLAVPMLVVIKSIADHVGPLKPLGRLMAP